MSDEELGTFEGARRFTIDRVLPSLRDEYEGHFHPFFAVFARVDKDGNRLDSPILRELVTRFTLGDEERRVVFTAMMRDVISHYGPTGFVLVIDTDAAGLGGSEIVVWLDHDEGRERWVARTDAAALVFESSGTELGIDGIERLLPRQWMN